MIELKLRPFQEREIPALLNRRRGGLAWDMGLGKTAGVSTVGARARLKRWLVLCPDNAFSVWRDDAPRWIKLELPHVTVRTFLLDKGPDKRAALWDAQDDPPDNEVWLFICTPDSFLRDWATRESIEGKKRKQVQFVARPKFRIPQILIFDEAKRIRSRNSLVFQTIKAFIKYYPISYRYMMTGTPGHSPKDFWTMLHIIDPKVFSSYWKLVDTFHETIEGPWGKEILGPKNIDNWHLTLKRYFSVIKEDDEGIAEQRPPITRQLLRIKMDAEQHRLYEELEREMLALTEASDLIIAQNSMTLVMRLRQLCICPTLLAPTLGVGAAIRDLCEQVEPDQWAVIFCPFPAAFPHFSKYLQTRGYRVFQIRGGMGTDARDEQIAAYRQAPSIMLCSTLYAQAFSLEPATRSFSIGYDWDPDNNRQAEKRLHRLTSLNPITSYYYTFEATIDERLCEIVNVKQQSTNLTIPQNLRDLVSNNILVDT